MLQELAAETGQAGWAIASMLFFLAVWLGVLVWVVRSRAEDMAARARLPLEADPVTGSDEGIRNQEPGSGPTPES
jgi:hypothetical protein